MPPCSDLCQSVFSRGQDHKWEASPPPQTSLASGQVNLTISQSPTLTKLSVCQIFRDRIMKTHNLIWSIHWHTPKNGIEHQVKSTWQLISPRLTKLSVCQIFTDRIMKTHNIGRSIHWHIPKDGIEPAWEVWQLSEGDWSLPLEWQFSRNWSGDDRWLCGLVHGGMIVVVHCGETTSSPFFWNLPGSWNIEAHSEGQYCKE